MAFANKPKDGGYCPQCDTVWASPGKCRCEPIQNKNAEQPSQMHDLLVRTWNTAIEAAAKCVDKDTRSDQAGYEFGPAIEIRKLKK